MSSINYNKHWQNSDSYLLLHKIENLENQLNSVQESVGVQKEKMITIEELVTKIYNEVVMAPKVDKQLNELIDEGILKCDLQKTRELLEKNKINLNKRPIVSVVENGVVKFEEAPAPLQEIINNLDRYDNFTASDAIEFIELLVEHGAQLNNVFSDYPHRSNTLVLDVLEISDRKKRQSMYAYLIQHKEEFKYVDLSKDFQELHYCGDPYYFTDEQGCERLDCLEKARFLFEMGASIPRENFKEIVEFFYSYHETMYERFYPQLKELFAEYGYDLYPPTSPKINYGPDCENTFDQLVNETD